MDGDSETMHSLWGIIAALPSSNLSLVFTSSQAQMQAEGNYAKWADRMKFSFIQIVQIVLAFITSNF